MKKLLIVGVAAVVFGLLVCSGLAEQGTKDIMRQKLDYSQGVSAAKDQNLDRAMEAYTRVARSCMECHKLFRREQFLKRQADGTFK